jgi:RNA polymerase sigma-70 factor (ECF subfamily)
VLGSLARSRLRPDAFVAFYDAHHGYLIRYFAGATRDADVALDLTAEVFVKAFEKRGTFRGHGDIEAQAWLWAIARNELASFQRAHRLRAGVIERLGREPVLADETLSSIERLAGVEMARAHIRRAVAGLPAEHREVIWLRFGEGLDAPAVARRLGLSSDNVRARLSRAYRSLRASTDAGDAAEALEQS